MKLKRFASAAATILLMFCAAGAFSESLPYADMSLCATADYDFEFIDEDDAEDIVNAYADEYDEEDTQEERTAVRQFNPVRSFFISLIIGLLIGLVAVSIMKSSMKSVHKKAGATDYRKQDSFKLSVKTDEHLGTKVEKTPIARAASPQNPSVKK